MRLLKPTALAAHHLVAPHFSCGPPPQYLAWKIGYSPNDIESVPEDSILGLGCGNPVALAKLKEGETVLDLGSGAGIDVFLGARTRNRKI